MPKRCSSAPNNAKVPCYANSLLLWLIGCILTFLHNLKEDFFTEDARKILSLLENDLLKFDVTKIDVGEGGGKMKTKSGDTYIAFTLPGK